MATSCHPEAAAMTDAPTAHALHWFEIPALDLDRAQHFYEAVLGTPLRREGDGPQAMVLFPREHDGVGGCLSVACDGQPPAPGGTVVYLSTPSIDEVLARVPHAGGRVRVPKTALPDDWGYCAHITDTEGNRVGLHSLA
jgi:predicted enzyme related to lactoylglutathione lyase